jgi:trehalose 2-sulfotransferase
VSSPDKRYVIIFTARSGSSWLTNVLSETKQLGYHEEYLNPNFIRGVASAVNSTIPEEFLAGLQRRRQTPNGVFGIEAREVDIELFGADCFFEVFDENTIFFNLWRENLVAQAVSLFRAVETQQFHIKQGERTSAPPVYNLKSVSKWMIHLALQENANLAMLTERQLPFINLCYEAMVDNRRQMQRLFAKELEVQLSPEALIGPVVSPLTKIGDSWNEETEKRFRADAEKLVSRIEVNRKMKSYVADRANGEWIHPGLAVMTTPVSLVRSA